MDLRLSNIVVLLAGEVAYHPDGISGNQGHEEDQGGDTPRVSEYAL